MFPSSPANDLSHSASVASVARSFHRQTLPLSPQIFLLPLSSSYQLPEYRLAVSSITQLFSPPPLKYTYVTVRLPLENRGSDMPVGRNRIRDLES